MRDTKPITIQPSDTNRDFKTGAVRGEDAGKGKPSLLPLVAVCLVSKVTGGPSNLPWTGLVEVSKVFEAGCHKYAARNWEKGMPLHCFVDSAERHLGKYLRGDQDEPHVVQYAWNLLCLLQMHVWVHRGDRPYDLYEVPDDKHFIGFPAVDIGEALTFTPDPETGVGAGGSMKHYADESVWCLALYLDGCGLQWLCAAVANALYLVQGDVDYREGVHRGITNDLNARPDDQ